MTSLRKRRNPSSIDARRTLVISLEKATSGELAILRTSAANTGSGRIRSHSSRKEVSVPDNTFRALKATRGKGGRLSRPRSISGGAACLDGLAVRLPIIKKDTSEPGARGHLTPPASRTAEDIPGEGSDCPKLHTLSARRIRTASDEGTHPDKIVRSRQKWRKN